MNSLGVTDRAARAAIPSLGFGNPTVVDATSGFWSVQFSLPDANGQYRVFTRNHDGSLTQERFSREGASLGSSTTSGQPFTTVQSTDSTGATTLSISSPAGAVLGSVTHNTDGSQTTTVYGSSGSVVQTTDTYRYDDGSTFAITTTDTGSGSFTVTTNATDNLLSFAGTGTSISGPIQLTAITLINGQPPLNAAQAAASLQGNEITLDDLIHHPGRVAPIVEAVDPSNPSGIVTPPASLLGGIPPTCRTRRTRRNSRIDSAKGLWMLPKRAKKNPEPEGSGFNPPFQRVEETNGA